MLKLEFNPTQRGFFKGEFDDLYGQKCSIQESSLATDNAIWFGCNEGVHYDQKDMPVKVKQEKCCARMHLNQEQVRELLPVLLYFAEHGALPRK